MMQLKVVILELNQIEKTRVYVFVFVFLNRNVQPHGFKRTSDEKDKSCSLPHSNTVINPSKTLGSAQNQRRV